MISIWKVDTQNARPGVAEHVRKSAARGDFRPIMRLLGRR